MLILFIRSMDIYLNALEAPASYGIESLPDGQIKEFHHKKFMRRFSLDDFIENCLDVKGLAIEGSRHEVEYTIFSFNSESELLGSYLVPELNEEIWENSYYLLMQVHVHWPNSILFLKFDKSKEKELSIYGYNVGGGVYEKLDKRYFDH